MSHQVTLLALRQMSEDFRQKCSEYNFVLKEHAALKIRHDISKSSRKTLLNTTDPLICTSQHAVRAISQLSLDHKKRIVYAIRGKTSRLLEEMKFKLKGTAPRSEELAEVIINSGEKAVLHCTTKHRLGVLEEKLTTAGIVYRELIVYTKEQNPQHFSEYDALLFYSPSQVDVFLAKNELNSSTPAFCIGPTTANYLKDIGHKTILTSERSTSEDLFQCILNYYKIEGKQTLTTEGLGW